MKTLSLFVLLAGCLAAPALAQGQGAPLPAPLPSPPAPEATAAPPTYLPQELDRVVSPIALYPDPLLGQILTAATFSPEITDAARWADEHHYVAPGALPAAIAVDRLPWQPSVQSLLPFPQVLGMMASDMPWTEELGDAFLAAPDQVMDAVQRGTFIEILPVNAAFVVVPYYDPAVVFAPPPRGTVVAGAINFRFGVAIGAGFAPWGWGSTRFAWNDHVLVVNSAPWRRTWSNRAVYVHPFAAVRRYPAVRPADGHNLHVRTERERAAERKGQRHDEEHRRDDNR